MTTPPTTDDPGDGPRDDQQSGELHTCYNCFAEFGWAPTIRDGEEYCCPGCVEGGPCICTYDGAPRSVEAEQTPASVDPEGEPHLPHLPHLPNLKEETWADNHREVLLQAIDELPDQLQLVARLRIVNAATSGEIAHDTGLPASEVEQLLLQAQTVIGRILGPEFVIEYIEEEDRPQRIGISTGAEPLEQEQVPELGATPDAAATGAGPDHSEAIRAPLEALTAPLLGAGGQGAEAETAIAQSTIREALRDASAIFRLAAERLGENADEHPLRRLLADETTDEIRIIARGLTDPALYLVALDSLGSTKWARVESKEEDRTIFSVEVASSSALVRDVMGLEPPFRPTRLIVHEDELQISLPPEASGGAPPTGSPAELKTAPVFELGADAFFGARHFVTMGGVQGPPHHHSYRVEALMESSAQDSDGVVIGFGEARKLVEDIVVGFNETLLNTIEPFIDLQPTSENIAKVIFDRLKAQLVNEQIRLKQVRVWESPTNSASYSDAALAI